MDPLLLVRLENRQNEWDMQEFSFRRPRLAGLILTTLADFSFSGPPLNNFSLNVFNKASG